MSRKNQALRQWIAMAMVTSRVVAVRANPECMMMKGAE